MPDFLIEGDQQAGLPLIGDAVTGAGITGDQIAEAIAQLLADPTAPVYVAADLRPRDPVTRQIRRKLITNAARLHTEPDDDPPSAIHRSLLVQGWSTQRRLTASGQFLGSSAFNVGTLLVLNDMGQTTDWLDLDWSNAEVILKIGGITLPDGSPYPYSLFYPYFTGIVDSIDPESQSDAALTLTIVGRRKLLDQQAVEELYSGLGGGVLVPASQPPNPYGNATGTMPSINVTGTGFAVEWFGRISALAIVGYDLIRVTNGANSYGITIDSPNGISASTLGGGVGYYDVQPGDNVHAIVSVHPDNQTADVYVGVNGAPVELMGTLSLLAPITDLAGAINIGSRFSGFGADASTWEARIWRTYQDVDAISSREEGPLTTVTGLPDLVECWKFEDGVLPTARGQLGVANLTLSGTASFVPSYEGDDPVVFPGGPSGKTKPDGWGRARSVALTNVDSQRHAYQWKRASSGPSPDLSRVYVGGAPLAPDETISSTASGQIVFSASAKTITLSAPLTGRRLIAGQTDPARTGQRVAVTGSASNNSTFTVAPSGISADGLTITVLETPANESAPSGTVIRTLAADAGYTYDLAHSVILTPSSLTGDATADVTLWLSQGGTARVSEVMAQILGAPVDTSALLWDPEINYWLAPGSSTKFSEILDKLAFSAAAWWIETRDGTGYRLGTYQLPNGTPQAVIGASKISSIKNVQTITPYYRFRVAYDPTWQTVSTLSGSVSQSQRDLLQNPWRFYPRTAPASFRKQWPLSQERTDPFQTYLTNRDDAKTWADLAQPLYMAKRRWLDLDVEGLSLLSIDLNDCVWVSHPDPRYQIVDGALCRILAMEEQTSSDIVSMEVFR